mmetsp:Transcript_16482/g.55426  ORF Transcript_16482/g.55426 Transcript_16482/m.55426 type:complete len:231 (-) Transcript_16482:322-1014(-)
MRVCRRPPPWRARGRDRPRGDRGHGLLFRTARGAHVGHGGRLHRHGRLAVRRHAPGAARVHDPLHSGQHRGHGAGCRGAALHRLVAEGRLLPICAGRRIHRALLVLLARALRGPVGRHLWGHAGRDPPVIAVRAARAPRLPAHRRPLRHRVPLLHVDQRDQRAQSAVGIRPGGLGPGARYGRVPLRRLPGGRRLPLRPGPDAAHCCSGLGGHGRGALHAREGHGSAAGGP